MRFACPGGDEFRRGWGSGLDSFLSPPKTELAAPAPIPYGASFLFPFLF